MKTIALALAKRGFKVFPVAVGEKTPPLLSGWPQRATSDPKEIEMFWLAVPNANIGIHCEGLIVVDVDVKKGGKDALNLLRLQEDFPATLCTRTPSGGEHHFFRLPAGHGGVPNGVNVLGTGIDVRSTGGYVVAPGSVVSAGAYAFEDPAREVAPAPDWLVQRLGRQHIAESRNDVGGSRVPDAAESVVERARQWLAGQLPAVQGQGGDARTFAVACGLRDLGVSRTQAYELLHFWNLTCMPPWEPEDLRQKVNNAYRYAENDAGAKAAQPEDFPVISLSQESAAVSDKSLLHIRTITELAAADDVGPGYVIKGLLQRASYAEIYGAPGEGKTFISLDVAYCVAAGLPWMTRKVHAGPVLYLAYEGQGGLRKRARALEKKYGKKEPPLYVISASYNLREISGRHALRDDMAKLPAKPVLVVIDTFARALMGGDENSAQDVGAFNSAVAALIQATGACVMIVHHSGKDKSKGARGSSALLGAIDTDIEVDEGKVIARKQRDVEILPPIGFKLAPVLVGLDSDGEEVTSCIVESATVAAAPLGKLKGTVRQVLQVLEEMSPSNKPVDREEWKEQAMKELGISRSTGYKHVGVLIAGGYVLDVGGMCSRRHA